MVVNLMWQQIDEILDEAEYSHEHSLGEFTRCELCGQQTSKCIGIRERSDGVKTWDFLCINCGGVDWERW